LFQPGEGSGGRVLGWQARGDDLRAGGKAGRRPDHHGHPWALQVQEDAAG